MNNKWEWIKTTKNEALSTIWTMVHWYQFGHIDKKSACCEIMRAINTSSITINYCYDMIEKGMVLKNPIKQSQWHQTFLNINDLLSIDFLQILDMKGVKDV